MVAYAAEFSFGSRGAVARAAERQLAAVGAGASGDPGGEVPPVPARVGGGRVALIGRAAVAFTVVGWLAHLATIVTRGLAAHRVPWGNMYEFVLVVCFETSGDD